MSTIELFLGNPSDPQMEDPDYDPWDNDIQENETNFIRNLLKSEPLDDDTEWDGESEPPKSYTPEGDDYVQGGLR